MSKYVEKKHGIVIGSDNWFFFQDWNGDYHDTKCIWSAKKLYWENYSTLHVGVESTLRQLIYNKYKVEYEEPFTFSENLENKEYAGKTIQLQKYYHLTILKPHFVKWLYENTPGWMCPVGENRDGEIWFQKRSDALKFTNYLINCLDGERYL